MSKHAGMGGSLTITCFLKAMRWVAVRGQNGDLMPQRLQANSSINNQSLCTADSKVWVYEDNASLLFVGLRHEFEARRLITQDIFKQWPYVSETKIVLYWSLACYGFRLIDKIPRCSSIYGRCVTADPISFISHQPWMLSKVIMHHTRLCGGSVSAMFTCLSPEYPDRAQNRSCPDHHAESRDLGIPASALTPTDRSRICFSLSVSPD